MQDLKRIRRNLATRKTKRGSEVNSTEPSLWGFQIRKPTLLTRVFPAMFTGFYFLSIYYAMITFSSPPPVTLRRLTFWVRPYQDCSRVTAIPLAASPDQAALPVAVVASSSQQQQQEEEVVVSRIKS